MTRFSLLRRGEKRHLLDNNFMNSKRRLFTLFGLLCLLAACGQAGETAVSPQPTPIDTAAVPSPTVGETAVPLATDTSAPPTVEPTATLPPTVTASPVPQDLSLDASRVYLYPVPEIYAGDLVTFQILAHVPGSVRADQVNVHITVDGELLVDNILGWRNLAGEAVGLYEWVWDTTGLTGNHEVIVTLDPHDAIQQGDENSENNQVIINATVNDSALLSQEEQNATWVTAETNCCVVHVVSGTAAFRDLAFLLQEVEAAFQITSERLDEQPNRKYDVYLVDRVIGQGGYAGPSMVVSYLDRHYASNGLQQVLIHEAIHLMDRQFAPQRITFLAEGVAVWGSGGHFKPENIDQRAAALIEIDQYIPLTALINNFYPVQHEIGYLQAAGFVSYLVNTYGWSQFKTFYSDTTRDDAPSMAETVDVNLQSHFGVTLEQAEADWLAYLTQQPYDQAAQDDLSTTIRFYNTMRDYQQQYDPTAYFLTAWLPYPQELETSGNLADLTRHPDAEINVTLEVMLQAAESHLRTGDFVKANALLDSVERVLTHNGAFVDPLALSYLDVVRVATEQGYEVQDVFIDGNNATIQAYENGRLQLTTLTLTLRGAEWNLAD